MKGRWITVLTNHSRKLSMTPLKPWSASCVALWKSKDTTLKPTPTCVRRNNPSSQAETHCLSRRWQRAQFDDRDKSVTCCCQTYFLRPQLQQKSLAKELPTLSY